MAAFGIYYIIDAWIDTPADGIYMETKAFVENMTEQTMITTLRILVFTLAVIGVILIARSKRKL